VASSAARGQLEERLAGLLAGRAVHRDHRRGQLREEHHVRRWQTAEDGGVSPRCSQYRVTGYSVAEP
jgi:hypothetical protein